MIIRAKISEIEDILSITKACAENMAANGIFQWNGHYPSYAVFQKDIERDELYVYKDLKRILGVVALSVLMDTEYGQVEWLTPNDQNLYVHRLAIHPIFQGMGFAQRLMDFAEQYAKSNGFASIRLDTFSRNARNQKFYEIRGYKKLGAIFFPKQSDHPFYCYELVL